jgi:hypothetical protein
MIGSLDKLIVYLRQKVYVLLVWFIVFAFLNDKHFF